LVATWLRSSIAYIAEAMHFRRPLTDRDNVSAENTLGVMYEIGHRVPQDDVQAATWFRKAADQGDAFAQVNLGRMYDAGRGVPEDDAQAAIWYRKAADQGNAEAQVNLGRMYDAGRGVPQDDGEALSWYRKAADQGNAEARSTTSACCTSKAKVFRRTTLRRWSGSARRPTNNMPKRSSP
jgi:TPR repeat protein